MNFGCSHIWVLLWTSIWRPWWTLAISIPLFSLSSSKYTEELTFHFVFHFIYFHEDLIFQVFWLYMQSFLDISNIKELLFFLMI